MLSFGNNIPIFFLTYKSTTKQHMKLKKYKLFFNLPSTFLNNKKHTRKVNLLRRRKFIQNSRRKYNTNNITIFTKKRFPFCCLATQYMEDHLK